jgi:MFS family permease
MDRPFPWRRNIFVATAASFIGFTGFTLVMPFLPLYFQQLGVADVDQIAVWSGVSLGVTPAITALMAPTWGRLADRLGHKMMVERSLASFVLVMGAMSYVTRPWHVLALRALQGLFAGYGALSLTMAADSAPRDRMASAIGAVQTAQRLGPALGPVIGGAVAHLVGLRRAFLVSAGFYALALFLVAAFYRDRGERRHGGASEGAGPITFRHVLGFQNFILLMAAIFGLQFVDRSFGPILPLYVAELGVPIERIPILAGLLFSMAAGTGALGNYFCNRLLAVAPPRVVIAAGSAVAALGALIFGLADETWPLFVATAILGAGVGAGMTAAYTAAGAVIPAGARGAGFGVLTTASLAGLALSPIASGLLGATSIRAVFLLDVAALVVLAVIVSRRMVDRPPLEAQAPPREEM